MFDQNIPKTWKQNCYKNRQLPPRHAEKGCWAGVDDLFISIGGVLSLLWNSQRYDSRAAITHGAEKSTLVKSLEYKERL